MNQNDISTIATTMGQIPSGLFVLTSKHRREKTGMLVSWVMQAGFEPPMVSVAVKNGRQLVVWLSAGEPFVLNLLGENNKSLISHFGRGFDPGHSAFVGINVTETSEGLPILADALGYLECKPISNVDSGDHRIFLAEITAAQIAAEGQPYVHIRKNGLKY